MMTPKHKNTDLIFLNQDIFFKEIFLSGWLAYLPEECCLPVLLL